MRYLVATPKWIKFVLLFLLFVGINIHLVSAQTVKELEAKRSKIQKEINLTSKFLSETTQNKEAALQRFTTLRSQIKKRKLLIQTLKKEINITNKRIERTDAVIQALQADIEQLQKEYAIIINQAYRQKLTQSNWLFLFSAKDFNDAFRRWQYIKQYDTYRKKQANLIKETQITLNKKIDLLANKKRQKELLVDEQNAQNRLLAEELDSSNAIFNMLRKDEKRLKKNLDTFISQRDELDKIIEEIIIAATNMVGPVEQDVATIDEPESDILTAKSISTPVSSDELNAWTNSFESQRGRLPMPVNEGIVTRFFGQQAHPTISGITIQNNGIDIQTPKGANAKAIFEGVVAGTQFIPGFQHTVIIKHGEYFTVYSNLEEIFIKKGDRIQKGQVLGQISTNKKDKSTQIHFEVWRNKSRLNPKDWIVR